ncbi:hypothetical protein BC937DRAFT_90630 [Endogone sp. FLAS-F59071]|nr:hypothetical protein BC937DRAFT_90630 [Endogone sp. FLAS-F59071]|eukprot:RUS16934.1 hypothetical protein BC937DRAFT_90630 [Endogone sp. FLAS-F59071]
MVQTVSVWCSSLILMALSEGSTLSWAMVSRGRGFWQSKCAGVAFAVCQFAGDDVTAQRTAFMRHFKASFQRSRLPFLPTATMAIFVFRFIREWDPAAGGLEVIDVPTNVGSFPTWSDIKEKLRQEILANRIRLDVQDCFFTYTATPFVTPSSAPAERNYITNDSILRRAVERAGQVFGEEVRLEITISVVNPGPPSPVVPVATSPEGGRQDIDTAADKNTPVVSRRTSKPTGSVRRARSESIVPSRPVVVNGDMDTDGENLATPRKKTKRSTPVEQVDDSELATSPYTHRPVISKLPLPPGHRFIAYKYAHIPKRSTAEHPLQRTPSGALHMCIRLDRTPSFPRTIRLPTAAADALVASVLRDLIPVAVFVQARLHFPAAHYHSRVGHPVINSSGWVLVGRYTVGQVIDAAQGTDEMTEYPVTWVDEGRGVLCQGRCDEKHKEFLRRQWGEEKVEEMERDKVNRVTVCDCLDGE